MSSRLIKLAEAERAMRVQEVLLKAMSGEIKWYEAAEILQMSERQLRRWRQRYEEHGYDGLLDRRKQTPSPRRIPFATAHKVLRLYREEYRGFNVKHFHELMTSEHEIDVSYSWTKALLQEAGLVTRARKRGEYRRRRERKPCSGMLVHIDGSQHRWFAHPGDESQCLLVVLDDATSEILAARFVEQESTATCLGVLKEVVQERGTFGALYTDRASHFVYTPTAGQAPDRSRRTQLEQVLEELGIELICAWSPEARGRSERMFGTLQGRLPQELRRAGIDDYEQANAYLHEVYLPRHNANFSVDARHEVTAFIPVVGFDLDRVFARRFERTVARDNTVHIHNRVLQLPRIQGVATMAGRKVELREHLDGTLEVLVGKRAVARFEPVPTESEQQKKQVN